MSEPYVKTNFHTHSTFCDGKNTPEENVRAAIEKEIAILGFSSHSLYPFSLAGNLNYDRHAEYAQEIRTLQKKYANQIQILLGFEADYIPGFCSPRFENYAAFNPDFLIGSVHFIYDGKTLFAVDNTPQILAQAVRDVYAGDAKKAVCAYFSAERDMLQNGDFTILGHADLIRKFNGTLHLFDESESWYKNEIDATAQKIAQAGVIVEINTGAISRGYMTDPYPSDYFLSRLYALHVPITLCSDAHAAPALDCAFDRAREKAKKAGYTEKAMLTADGIRFCAL